MADRIPVRRTRVILAFLLAPLAAPLTIYLLAYAGSHMSLADWLGILLLYLLFAYAAEVFLGIVAWVTFRSLGLTSAWAFAAAGGLIAWLTVAIVWRSVSRSFSSAPLFVIAGVVSGLVFRFVALRP